MSTQRPKDGRRTSPARNRRGGRALAALLVTAIAAGGLSPSASSQPDSRRQPRDATPAAGQASGAAPQAQDQVAARGVMRTDDERRAGTPRRGGQAATPAVDRSARPLPPRRRDRRAVAVPARAPDRPAVPVPPGRGHAAARFRARSSPPGHADAATRPDPPGHSAGPSRPQSAARARRSPRWQSAVREPATTTTDAAPAAAPVSPEPIAPPTAAAPDPAPLASPPPAPSVEDAPRSTATPRTDAASAGRRDGAFSGPAPMVPARASVATGAAASRGPAADDRRERASAAPRSPLTRTVVRVLEVVPPGVRLALGALALLGVLLAVATGVQTMRGRRLERQRRRLASDIGLLQSALLPALPERIGGARVTAAYRPAEGLAAGGDFFDAFALPGGRTAVLVGDVMGHGRDVVPLTALVRYNVRAYLQAGLGPRATLDVAAAVLAPQIGDRQVTVAVAIFDPGAGRLTYACAGHAPPLLLGTALTPVTASSSPPIGAGMPTGRRQTTIPLRPGAAVCFVTDGLAEIPLRGGGRLGEEGVAAQLAAIGPDGSAAELLARVLRHGARQTDDLAACMLTALPGGSERWSLRVEELEVDADTLRGGHATRFLAACGVDPARAARALADAARIIACAGTAVVEVRIGEQLADVRVAPPPAVALPIVRRRRTPVRAAASA